MNNHKNSLEDRCKWRGKSIHNNSWEIGFLTDILGENSLINDCNLVLTNTVGQYSGEKDKNGKEIYEDDIVKIKDKYIAKVVYGDNTFYYEVMDDFSAKLSCFLDDEVEVISNIYDNPEILKSK